MRADDPPAGRTTMPEKFPTLGLSTLAAAAVLLAGCASAPPPQPVATAPPPPPAMVTIAPQAGTPSIPTGTTTTTTVTTYRTVGIAPMAPPPARDELVSPSPGPQMVWEPGNWSFNGTSWDWIPGHYA